MKLLFATANVNKAKEIAALLPASYELLTLKDIDLQEDIPETRDTLEGNAQQKSEYVLQNFQLDCFADDTGLEIPALNNEPGVKSARYAGEQRDTEANMQLVLDRLKDKEDRTARFRTVISLELEGKQYLFEGIVNGTIREERSGEGGFGYDPIFEPENCGRTFGEMTMEEKNNYSHRARAFEKMIAFLKEATR